MSRDSYFHMEGLIKELLTDEINTQGEDFKTKYAMIDDLVNYVLGDNELQQMYCNTDTFASGFTPNIGKLVAKLLAYCRENETFQEEIQKRVTDCKEVPEGRTKETFVSDIASGYMRLLDGEGLIFYFGFLAIICELCSRFTDKVDSFTALKTLAKATLYVYWENTLKFDELDLFARNNLDNTEEAFVKLFSTVVDCLSSKDYKKF